MCIPKTATTRLVDRQGGNDIRVYSGPVQLQVTISRHKAGQEVLPRCYFDSHSLSSQSLFHLWGTDIAAAAAAAATATVFSNSVVDQ